MQRTIKTFSLVLALALFLLWGAPAVAQGETLDGKTFSGELVKKGKTRGDKDELIFKDGRFRSAACDPYGFGDAPYTATVNGDTTSFEAQTESAKYGTMKWQGTAKGDTLEATTVWSNKKGKVKGDYFVQSNLKK